MRRPAFLAIFTIAGLTVAVAALGKAALAGDSPDPLAQATPPPALESIPVSNETCLGCHGVPGLVLPLENGENLVLYVSPQEFADSIHGQRGYACMQCHTTVGDYPHPSFSAADVRDASLQLYQACRRCHASQYAQTQDSVHAAAMQTGNRNAAICTDCHTAHATRQLTDPATHQLLSESRSWIPQTCAQCHSAIYEKYLTSVHGAALQAEGNLDVPTCIDCHGVHNIEDPTTAAFRLNSPMICAGCHTNPEIMDKYGISTQVLETYVADFHGTTVILFEKQHPEAETNKPVCYDCHGVHDIKRPDDPEKGLQVRSNLLARCQVCHPDATANFPDAWLSHYIPSPQKAPLVYTVNLFYKIFIPGVLGSMAILVALDAGSALRRRFRARRAAPELLTMEAEDAQTTPAAGDLPGDEAVASSDEASSQEETGFEPPVPPSADQGEPAEPYEPPAEAGPGEEIRPAQEAEPPQAPDSPANDQPEEGAPHG